MIGRVRDVIALAAELGGPVVLLLVALSVATAATILYRLWQFTAAGLAVAMPVSAVLSWFEARMDAERVFAVIAEHILPVLLVFGLFARVSALGLLVMTAVIQIFVFPGAWVTHGLWAAALLVVLPGAPAGCRSTTSRASRHGRNPPRPDLRQAGGVQAAGGRSLPPRSRPAPVPAPRRPGARPCVLKRSNGSRLRRRWPRS